MAFKVFNLPVPNCAKQERELNSFLSTHRVLGRRVFATRNGDDSYLTVMLEVAEETRLPEQGTPPNIDISAHDNGPKLVRPDRPMSKEEEVILAELKQCRSEIAGNLRTHLFTVATNEDLEALAMLKPRNPAELSRVKGMGQKRVEKFGKYFLRVLDKYTQKDKKGGKSAQGENESPETTSVPEGLSCLPGLEEDALKELSKN